MNLMHGNKIEIPLLSSEKFILYLNEAFSIEHINIVEKIMCVWMNVGSASIMPLYYAMNMKGKGFF